MKSEEGILPGSKMASLQCYRLSMGLRLISQLVR